MISKKLFIFPVLLLFLGAGCLPNLPLKKSETAAPLPVSCDYNGKTYQEGEERPADDGCNACRCSRDGWDCTTIVCVGGKKAVGTIIGKLSYPSEAIPAQRVCAANLSSDKEYCLQTIAGAADFQLRVPGGAYWVYATASGDDSGRKAYFSEFVRCGLAASCADHSPIAVETSSTSTVPADPQDWYAASMIDSVVITPSKRLDDAVFISEGSQIEVEARGMSKIEAAYRPWPPKEGDETKTLGEAELQGTAENGVQSWRLVLPKGLQASHVFIVGTGPDGSVFRWRDLRTVRSE